MRNDVNILAMYESIPEDTREDIVEAGIWARELLAKKEGEGHEFFVSANKDGTVSCSFAKPEWAGDHCGSGMSHGAQAIVMAVCEYMYGA